MDIFKQRNRKILLNDKRKFSRLRLFGDYYITCFGRHTAQKSTPPRLKNSSVSRLKRCTAGSFVLPKNSDLSRKAAKYTKMTLKGVFYYHYYENFYTLSYIDKMWGTMRKCAFPEKMKL